MAVLQGFEVRTPASAIVILMGYTEILAKSITIIVGAGLEAHYIFGIEAADRLLVPIITGTLR